MMTTITVETSTSALNAITSTITTAVSIGVFHVTGSGNGSVSGAYWGKGCMVPAEFAGILGVYGRFLLKTCKGINKEFLPVYTTYKKRVYTAQNE